MATRADWERRVRKWKRSGLSRGEFADREGLRAETLGWWGWHLRRGPGAAAPNSDALVPAAVTFVELESSPVTIAPLEVLLENGRIVRVPCGFDGETLARVLDVADRR